MVNTPEPQNHSQKYTHTYTAYTPPVPLPQSILQPGAPGDFKRCALGGKNSTRSLCPEHGLTSLLTACQTQKSTQPHPGDMQP